MKYRQGVFFVVYFKKNEKIKYLILKRKLHWKGWEFPKGGFEKGEKILDVVKRELKEETGLEALNIKKFNFSEKYKYDKKYADRKGLVGQTFEALYAIDVKKAKVVLDKKEHSEFAWKKFNRAFKKLTWENQRKCLKIVDGWLKNNF
ncbi:MAG: NUDIX domain-containing protein [Nanoarchaeota archaeon]|nr:NUDIX domain-containing protein [Nanoarchaeota archaeon]